MLYLSCEKKIYKQKEAGFAPFLNKVFYTIGPRILFQDPIHSSNNPFVSIFLSDRASRECREPWNRFRIVLDSI